MMLSIRLFVLFAVLVSSSFLAALPISHVPRSLVELRGGSACATAGGVCGDINVAKCESSWIKGLCPGATNIQCCAEQITGTTSSESVSTPAAPVAAASACASQGGVCMSTLGNSCKTGFKSGMCPGSLDVKCCLSGVNFSKLEKCYPQGEAEDVKKRIGGAVSGDWITNTCAIRMSHTLNCAGKLIPQMGGESIRGKLPQNWNYIYRVKQLSPYVKKLFGLGVTTKAPTGRGVPISSVAGKKGIIYFDTTGEWTDATGHFDLWNGSSMVEASHDNKETVERYFRVSISITFWEFP